ncbi:hypothetical protein G6011_07812 [Alternaria panax]|uniref:Uncharacterized protein n=1 Tax=Alternaria panax TaxID=48097 RepID=A0AAD4FAQ1_9PLEO|nr:hypothetical protein G6011_07812 [Alternaria panax]
MAFQEAKSRLLRVSVSPRTLLVDDMSSSGGQYISKVAARSRTMRKMVCITLYV